MTAVAAARRAVCPASPVIVAIVVGATPAAAKPARCFTTDDGHFPCSFRSLDGRGSFRISAKGLPTYTIEVDSPGSAFGYADFGSGNVALPGVFRRERADPACWRNGDTSVQVCAW